MVSVWKGLCSPLEGVSSVGFQTQGSKGLESLQDRGRCDFSGIWVQEEAGEGKAV